MIKLNLKKSITNNTFTLYLWSTLSNAILNNVNKHLFHLERVERVKVQLIWKLCHSSLVGYSCSMPGSGFGQLEHPVSARSISDVTWRFYSGVRNCSSQCLKKSVWTL